MAHDPENALARKIRSVECQAVLWRKHEVWSAIQDRTARNRKRSRVYYCAAAVIAFMFVQVYSLRESPPTDVPVPSPYQALTTIDHSAENRLTAKRAEKVTKDQDIPDQRLPMKMDHGDAEAPVTVMTINHNKEVNLEDIDVPKAVAVESEPDIENRQLLRKAPLPEPRIRAIVGVASWHEDNSTALRQQKKNLFRKPEPTETEYDDRTINSIVIARLK